MASPSSAVATLEPQLSTYMEGRFAELSQNYIANQVFPVTPVAAKSGTFGKVVLEEILKANRNLQRQASANYWRDVTQFTTASYACEEYGIEELIDDREAAQYAAFLDAQMFAVDRAIQTILQNAEARVAALLNSATYSGNAALSNAAGASWNSTGNPLTDINTARNDFFVNTGYIPNALLVSRYAFDAMKANAYVTAAIASSGAGDPIGMGQITAAQVAQAVGVDRVIVAAGAKGGATAGQAAYVWSNTQAMLLRVATSGDMREPCIGRTFHWAGDGSRYGGTVEVYRDEPRRSTVIRCRHDVDEVLLHTEMGFMITGVTA